MIKSKEQLCRYFSILACNIKLHAFIRSVMLVCQPSTNLKHYYHCGMLTLYDVKIAEVIYLTSWNMTSGWIKTLCKLLLKFESGKWSNTTDCCSDNLFLWLDLLQNSNSAKKNIKLILHFIITLWYQFCNVTESTIRSIKLNKKTN